MARRQVTRRFTRLQTTCSVLNLSQNVLQRFGTVTIRFQLFIQFNWVLYNASYEYPFNLRLGVRITVRILEYM